MGVNLYHKLYLVAELNDDGTINDELLLTSDAKEVDRFLSSEVFVGITPEISVLEATNLQLKKSISFYP